MIVLKPTVPVVFPGPINWSKNSMFSVEDIAATVAASCHVRLSSYRVSYKKEVLSCLFI